MSKRSAKREKKNRCNDRPDSGVAIGVAEQRNNISEVVRYTLLGFSCAQALSASFSVNVSIRSWLKRCAFQCDYPLHNRADLLVDSAA